MVSIMALATGAAVAQVGLIAFIGLVAPHLVRAAVKPTHRWLLLLAALTGGVLLLAADVLARWLLAPQELPVGVLTAVLGGGYLLWLMHRRPHVSGARFSPRICARALGRKEVLRGIDLAVPSGRWTAVVGPNGAGKTTLLRALAQLLPHRGRVSLLGRDASDWSHRERAQHVAWLGQNEAGADDLPARDVVMLGRLPHQAWLAAPERGRPGGGRGRHAADAMPGIGAIARWAALRRRAPARAAGARAGGRRAAAADGRAAGQSGSAAPGRLAAHRARACGGGGTAVSVLHEITMALHADEMVVMDAGRVVHQGACGDAATHRALEEVFGRRIAVHSLAGPMGRAAKLTNEPRHHADRNSPVHKPYEKPEGERRGLVIVNTGDGKGKSTAAFGLALRAHGRGKAVKIYQFMKVPTARFGEHRMFEQLGIPIEGLGDGFSWKSQDLEHSAQLAREGWEKAEASHPGPASISWWCWTRSPIR